MQQSGTAFPTPTSVLPEAKSFSAKESRLCEVLNAVCSACESGC